MDNIKTYIDKYGDLSFEEKPFNEVDSLILCQLSYLEFDGYVPGTDTYSAPVPIKDIQKDPESDRLYAYYWYKADNKELFNKVCDSKRFGEMKLNFYVNVISELDDTQFSAVTYVLPDKSVYIAYRGTDATLVGWKEDIKLAYSEPVHAQQMAAEYMDIVSRNIAGSFRTGGHSKGGNLAVYAAMFCGHETRKRIIDIFDHDGPGFRPEIMEEGHFSSIKNRVHKFIPKASIVGILLEDDIDFEVIECWSVGALQHNSYVWKSENGEFIKTDSSENKRRKNHALNEWIYSLSDDELSLFIDVIYDLFTASGGKNVFDLANNPAESVSAALNKYKDMDQRTKDNIADLMKRAVEVSGSAVLGEYVEMSRRLKEEMKTWQEEASSFMKRLVKKKKL